MKHNFWFIPIVTSLLLGVFFLINQANATQTVQVTLSVGYGGFSCSYYPDGVSFGSTVALTAVLLTDDIWSGNFVCTDLNPNWSSQMLIQSTALTGIITGVIPPINITWLPVGSITQIAGNCGGLSLGTGGTLDAARTIIKKTGIQTCSFTYAPDGMTLNVPSYSPVTSYTAVMTITNPS